MSFLCRREGFLPFLLIVAQVEAGVALPCPLLCLLLAPGFRCALVLFPIPRKDSRQENRRLPEERENSSAWRLLSTARAPIFVAVVQVLHRTRQGGAVLGEFHHGFIWRSHFLRGNAILGVVGDPAATVGHSLGFLLPHDDSVIDISIRCLLKICIDLHLFLISKEGFNYSRIREDKLITWKQNLEADLNLIPSGNA
ncbi:hypothetical protein PIB30_010918 [Stylosanthes scabra]|uniref:Secreted protein n=1 Tax=Stylosanthes scabra TaxID=79078 RepID=A0ABU6T619_9FABA|nr:hypothetical protein [Stylosanthes scabra]